MKMRRNKGWVGAPGSHDEHKNGHDDGGDGEEEVEREGDSMHVDRGRGSVRSASPSRSP